MNVPDIHREIIDLLFSRDPAPSDVTRLKIEVCRNYRLTTVPKNSALLAAALPHERPALRSLLLVKPTRTLSGVAPVAVMTSPFPCPHGKCLPCAGGPEHPFASPQSYTGEEPAALRAREHGYDPYQQVAARLGQFELLGHHVDKVELIVVGGTMTARPAAYQEWFVGSCIRAMNQYRGGSGGNDTAAIFRRNEFSPVRCVAITFETRPDSLSEKAKNISYKIYALGSLGWVHLHKGDEDSAKAYLEEALALPAPYSSPLHFFVLGPALAIAVQNENWSTAIQHVKSLLHPGQQKMPDEVQSMLEQAVTCWEAGDVTSTQSMLVSGIELRKQMKMGYV